MIAQTRGVHTDAGLRLTGRTETIDEHCHQCQKLSAVAVARSHGRPCQRPLINPEGSGQLYHNGRQPVVCLTAAAEQKFGGPQLPYQKSQAIYGAGRHPFGPLTTTLKNRNHSAM